MEAVVLQRWGFSEQERVDEERDVLVEVGDCEGRVFLRQSDVEMIS